MIRIRSASRMLLALALGFPLLVAAGCGGSAAARPVDEDTARRALHDALEAWKGGEPHDALSKRPAPIRVADEDWLSGARLLSYQVEPGGEQIGTNLTCDVVLTLKGQKGRKAQRRVSYRIGTDPVPMVIRQD
jgi:hypothetical protein